MKIQEIAYDADMIIAGYAYTIKGDYIEVIDLNNTDKRAVIQNNDIAESLMSDGEDDLVLKYYRRNREILEETVYA